MRHWGSFGTITAAAVKVWASSAQRALVHWTSFLQTLQEVEVGHWKARLQLTVLSDEYSRRDSLRGKRPYTTFPIYTRIFWSSFVTQALFTSRVSEKWFVFSPASYIVFTRPSNVVWHVRVWTAKFPQQISRSAVTGCKQCFSIKKKKTTKITLYTWLNNHTPYHRYHIREQPRLTDIYGHLEILMKPIREHVIGKTSENQKPMELCNAQVRTASILITVTPSLCIFKHISAFKVSSAKPAVSAVWLLPIPSWCYRADLWWGRAVRVSGFQCTVVEIINDRGCTPEKTVIISSLQCPLSSAISSYLQNWDVISATCKCFIECNKIHHFNSDCFSGPAHRTVI